MINEYQGTQYGNGEINTVGSALSVTYTAFTAQYEPVDTWCTQAGGTYSSSGTANDIYSGSTCSMPQGGSVAGSYAALMGPYQNGNNNYGATPVDCGTGGAPTGVSSCVSSPFLDYGRCESYGGTNMGTVGAASSVCQFP